MGTFSVSPQRGKKGTYLSEVRPLFLGNGECPHFLSPFIHCLQSFRLAICAPSAIAASFM
jgi:hypothetical protein